ncbi:MAG TPA: response regulator [Frankiaceae bacterium]|jgi:two-component system phosphate regulon response regulator PhoB|nr:response regulator [Frankiaceae bacterium]
MDAARRVVLVVDDEAITREVVTVMLGIEGVEVHAAHDGEQALELARDVRPDLVLLDVMMPGIDGFEVCRRLRDPAATGHRPRVVMLTAKSDEESRRVAAEAGAEAYLVKPFSAIDLFRVVEGAA